LEKIKRYTTHWSAEMTEWSKDGVEVEGGEWVRYDDHIEAINKSEEKCADLTKRIWWFMRESE